jgi:hypothetical protein
MFAGVSALSRIRARGGARAIRARRISLGAVTVACFALACAAIQQHPIGWNEASHYAQVRALDRGTPIIDAYQRTTGDKAYYHGHYYGDKAPGLALLTLPVYHVVRAAGIVRPLSTVHLLVVFGCVLPAAIMMLLAFWLVQRREPGQGAAVALTLGLATLVLPFATLFFSHVLSACLGFAAFCLLWLERDRGGGLGLIAGAGLLAGFAVSTEYPLAVLAVLLGLYVIWRRAPVKAAIAYGGGLLAGLVPLLLYDWWAFGAPLHLSYSYVAANSSGVLGLGAPSLRRAVELLLADRGLLVVTPVVAAGIAGIAILYREGRRRDAVIPAAVVLAYFGYNTCYYLPFGGGVPGPRFLITMLPFLAVPLGAAYRKAPISTLALAIVSATMMVLATLTGPILATSVSTHTWWRRLELGHFRTPVSTVWIFGIFAILAILAAARASPRLRVRRLDLELAVLGVGSWLAVTRAGPALLASDLSTGHVWGLAALVILVIALAAIATRLALGNRLALIAGVPLAALAVRSFDHTTLALCLVAVSLALLIVLAQARRLQLRVGSLDDGADPH